MLGAVSAMVADEGGDDECCDIDGGREVYGAAIASEADCFEVPIILLSILGAAKRLRVALGSQPSDRAMHACYLMSISTVGLGALHPGPSDCPLPPFSTLGLRS